MTPLEATKENLKKRLDNSGVSMGTTSSPTFLGVLARHAFVVKNSDRASGIFLEDWTPSTISAYTHQYLCKFLPYLENRNQPIATLTTEDLDVAIFAIVELFVLELFLCNGRQLERLLCLT